MFLPHRHTPYPSQLPSQHNSTLHGHIPNSRSFFGAEQQPSLLHPSSGSSFITSAERHAHGGATPISGFPKVRSNEIALAPRDRPDHVRTIIPPQYSPPEAPITHEIPHAGFDHFAGDLHGGGSSPVEATDQKQTGPSRTRKQRRERPRIQLAPGQPPTTQGRPRERVYVACLQCRNRKIRCDGAKPTCHNCSKRISGHNDCNYDSAPKRRGPDKVPGARQRVPRESSPDGDQAEKPPRRRTRTGTTSTASPGAAELVPNLVEPLPQTKPSDSPNGLETDVMDFPALVSPAVRVSGPSTSLVKDDLFGLSDFLPTMAGNRDNLYNHQEEDDRDLHTPSISYEPSLNFSRKTWWDSLLSLYTFPVTCGHQPSLTSSQREAAAQGITSEIRYVFRESNYFFSFFHVSTFFSNYFDPSKRERMQPSLILALLAIATFWQSSELGRGVEGRERALRFRDEAQSALDASLNAGSIDETLAQAAWLLAMFEVCAHPRHSTERSGSALAVLDSIIRRLALTTLDAGNPNTTVFPGSTAATTDRKPGWFPNQSSPVHGSCTQDAHGTTARRDTNCSCEMMTLKAQNPESAAHTPLWSMTPAWCASWSLGEIMKESCRRLAWSSMILAAGHTSYAVAHNYSVMDLFISDPANYALLFSAEAVAQSPFLFTMYSPKDTVWALHDRALMLWHSCTRMRKNTHATDLEKSQFAMKVWLEADALEAALNSHTCGLERASIFQAREFLFNTRMCISHEFQRYIPLVSASVDVPYYCFCLILEVGSNVNGLFHREKAKEWLTHQSHVAERLMMGLHTITGYQANVLARRPFFVFWFMGQISRALLLWECDNTLTIALDVCKALLPAVDYLTSIWPCAEQRYRYEALRERIDDVCYVAGVNPPPRPNLELPSSPAL